MLDKVDPAQHPHLRAVETPNPAEGGFDRPAAPAPEPVTDPVVTTPAERGSDPDARPGMGWRIAKGLVQVTLTLLILAGAAYATRAIIADKPERSRRPAFTTSYTVQTVEARRADHRPSFVAYGQTVAGRTVDLRSLVGGEIVAVSPNLQAGARVKAGEELVAVDRFAYEGAVAEAEAGLAEAQARIAENEARIAAEESKEGAMREQLQLAQADLDRAALLRKRRQGTQQQVDTRQLVVSQRQQALDQSAELVKIEQARLEQQRAGLGRLQWALQRAERDLASTVLKAPFDAVVRTSAAEIGRLVSANDVVVSLYEAGVIEARFTLNDAAFGRLQASDEGLIGREVAVRWAVGGRTYEYPAKIVRLGADIASNRGGVEVFARLEPVTDQPALRPGAFVEVEVPDVTYRGTFALPDTALFDDKVYVSVEGKLEERSVEVAAFDDDRVLVRSGVEGSVKEGDRVLVTRITEVSAGLNVREEGEAAPATQQRPGRPSREELERIAAANGITLKAFRALDQEERRAMVRKFRQDEGEKSQERVEE